MDGLDRSRGEERVDRACLEKAESKGGRERVRHKDEQHKLQVARLG